MHLLGYWCSVPDGWIHLLVPDQDRDETRWKSHRQIGATDDEDRILQWIVHPACYRPVGLPLLRVLQPGRLDDAVAPGELQHVQDSLSITQTAAREGAKANIRGVHGQVRVLNAGGSDEQCVAVEREDCGQLAEVQSAVTGSGFGATTEGHCLCVDSVRM